ncbi:hypothetical protein GCM10009819_30970 [Agromyces tropicus]|uniref:MBL fold metallo-hydrolase n=1 Tax=Agromyces tropicus TaxID=555371 RepID=A0ABN2USV9_9MICO
MSDATVTIRMYNPGFGDCFLVTVADGTATWRMLLDCGVHSHGRAPVGDGTRPIGDVVAAVIAQLAEESPDGRPRLDVVAATHRHSDHVSGFADDAWAEVEVGEVWLPFVEDGRDADATAIRHGLVESATALERMAALAADGRPLESWRPELALAMEFAVNSGPNLEAAARLVDGGFAGGADAHAVRFLPDRHQERNRVALPIDGAAMHVLGPSRDPEQLKRMDPPSAVRWLEEAAGQLDGGDARSDIFDPMYAVPDDEVGERVPIALVRARDAMRLSGLALDEAALLRAASILERSVNNTSLFLVLDVRGTRFVFVGDSQYGAWQHVLDDPHAAELVTGAAFYKVGHHGSHNATPRPVAAELVRSGGVAMVPVGTVERWKDSIPESAILDTLRDGGARVIRADDPEAGAGGGDRDLAFRVGPDGLWSEVRFTVA